MKWKSEYVFYSNEKVCNSWFLSKDGFQKAQTLIENSESGDEKTKKQRKKR